MQELQNYIASIPPIERADKIVKVAFTAVLVDGKFKIKLL